MYTLFAMFFVGVGAYLRPGIDIGIEVASAFVSPKEIAYSAPESDYERRSKELFYSAKHQATCMANAKAIVSLQITDEMLKETKKQQLISSYDLPMSLVK